MEKIVILDTSSIIDFFSDSGKADLVEDILLNHIPALSSITIYELFNGVSKKKHIEQRHQFVELCDVYSITKEIAILASELYNAIRKKGITIQNEDLLIAATAISYGIPLLTSNTKHFANINELELL